MRILGIETSSVRGSVALVEGEQTLAVRSHEQQGAHDASLQPLIEQVLSDAGWRASDLDRIAVGTGPGSFTGLRVGIALAQGISEGLGIALVGVGSLQAMAAAAPAASSQLRVPLLDARRGEYFLAVYSPDGRERLPPQIVADAASVERLVAGLSGGALLLGRCWEAARSELPHHASDETELPHARWTARLGASLEPAAAVLPLYLRPPVAVVPQLAARPLSIEIGTED